MSFLTDIFTSSAGTLVKDVSDAVKPFVTTEADRLKIENDIQTKILSFTDNAITHADAYESELTKRLQADSSSDSWLSKNIRPMSLVYLLGCFSLLAITDGNLLIHSTIIAIKPTYIAALQSFTEYGMMFYFGGRSIEKITGVVSQMLKK